MAKIIIVDEQRCLACKTCMIECAMAHTQAETLAEALSDGKLPAPRVHVEPCGRFGMPLQCRHCQDAPCIAVCPTDAVHRVCDEGPVLLEQNRCIGCKLCMIVCPFGVIDMSRDGKAMIKCDMCLERTERGEQPACVAACSTGALQYVEVDDYLRQRRRRAAAVLMGACGRPAEASSEKADGSDEG